MKKASPYPTANEVRVKTVCFTLLAGTLVHMLVKEIAAPTKVPAGTLFVTVPLYTSLYADKPHSNSFFDSNITPFNKVMPVDGVIKQAPVKKCYSPLNIQIITSYFIKRSYSRNSFVNINSLKSINRFWYVTSYCKTLFI
ncbi:hypothetical protein KY998_00590 [Bacillus paralicheniformis]|nr:hypothetical protein KY997_16030 [Bacillus paralicheniformis]UAL26504.1 hypothetical protein KY998_00590 [Bacillus paralicheniformis]